MIQSILGLVIFRELIEEIDMSTEDNFARIFNLQSELGKARDNSNIKKEIEILIEIGKIAFSDLDLGSASLHFNLAHKRIKATKSSLGRLHDVLAHIALILRYRNRLLDSLQMYKEATEAAKKYANNADVAYLIGRQGAIYRLLDKPNEAKKSFETSRSIYSQLGEEGKTGLADQIGNLGLLAADSSDDVAAADAYRKATEIAESTNADDLVVTWGINLGNVYVRQKRYSSAWHIYAKAETAALAYGEDPDIYKVAVNWATGYRTAHLNSNAAETLLRAADIVKQFNLRSQLIRESLSDLWVAGEHDRVIELGNELIEDLRAHAENRERINQVEQIVESSSNKLSQSDMDVSQLPDDMKILDGYIPSRMSECVTNDDIEGVVDVAHLICDVNLGLDKSDEESWRQVINDSSLRFRVINEGMMVLCKAGRPEESFEISQRFKCVGFCRPNIDRLRIMEAPNRETAHYIACLNNLKKCVDNLKGSIYLPDSLQRVEAVRAAGEKLLEAGILLRDRDPILHARLGGIVSPQELINALPISDPAGIVDISVGGEGTIIHILRRVNGKVMVIAGISEVFTAEHAMNLLDVWAKHRIPHEFDEQQEAGIKEISKVLHDRLFCRLADVLSDNYIPQIILIPDPLIRHLPLHLAEVCSQNLQNVIEKINIKDMTSDVDYFSEVFPVEYASCAQLIVVSQHQKRPKKINRVLSFANPNNNLPATETTNRWLKKILPKSVELTSYVGKEVTEASVQENLDKAEIVIIGNPWRIQ